MIIAANSSNPEYPPSFNYDGWSGSLFSWAQNCPASGGSGCEAIDEAIVKFDLYGAPPPAGIEGAPGQNLTNLYVASTTLGGTWPQGTTDLSMASAGINLASNDVFQVTLTYNGTDLFETVKDLNTTATYTNTYTTAAYGDAFESTEGTTSINLPSIIGANTAFVGFGGGTGAATMDVYLNTWTYTVDSPGSTATATATRLHQYESMDKSFDRYVRSCKSARCGAVDYNK